MRNSFSVIIYVLILLGFNKPAMSQFSGTYLIGENQDYESLSEIVDAMAADGVLGPVTINILPGSYEGQIIIPAIYGVSELNDITISSSTNDSSDVVLYASPINEGAFNEFNYVIALDAASHIKIKNITLKNNSSYYGSALVLRNNASNNSLENVHFYRTPESILNMRYSIVRTSEQAHYNEFTKCKFTGGSYAWYGYGEDDILDSLNTIESCVFEGQSVNGIYAKKQYQFSATDNSIDAGDVYSLYRAIYLDENEGGFFISGNRIRIDHPKGGHGIDSYYCSESDSTKLISNNFISIYCEDNNTQTGISITSTSGLQLYHNTVNLYGFSPFSKCVKITGNSSFPSEEVSIKNNIFINKAYRLCLEYDSNTEVESDFNWLYSNGSYFGEWLGQDQISFTSWKNMSGQDINSKFMPPALIDLQNEEDLYVQNDTLAFFGDSLGILLDIDGVLRDLSNPRVGAHEYNYVEGEPSPSDYPELLCTSNEMQNLWWSDLNGGEFGKKIIALENNNFLITGVNENGGFIMDSSLTNPGITTPFIAEWNVDSQLVRLYESSFTGKFLDICQQPDGSIVALGYVYGEFNFADAYIPPGDSYNYFLASYDSLGNELWCKTRIQNSGSLKVQDFAQSHSGNIAWISQYSDQLVEDGQTYSGEGSSNLFLQVYDSDGDVLWSKQMDGNFHVMEQHLAFNSNNKLIVAGRMSDHTHIDDQVFLCDNDIYLWKFDSNGFLENKRTFGGPGIEYPKALKVDANDNIIVAGDFNWGDFVVDTEVYPFQGEYDAFVVKFNADFEYEWSWHFGTLYPQRINDIDLDPQGNVVVGSKYAVENNFSYTYNMNLTKLHAFSGEELWNRNYGLLDDNEEVFSLAVNSLGDILATGNYESTLVFENFLYALSDNTSRTAIMHYTDDNPYPLVQIQNETCPGLSNASIAFLNADESWEISWDNGEEGPILDSISAGFYEVLIENDESCNFIARYQVTSPPLNGIESETQSICHGDSLWLSSGSGADIYQWSNGSTEEGTYYTEEGWAVLSIQEGDCSLSDSLYLTLIIPPIWPEILADTTLCFEPMEVNLDGDYTYVWNDDYEGAYREIDSSGLYEINALSESCLFSSPSFEIAFVPEVTFNSNLLQAYCFGDSLLLDESPEFMFYTFNDTEAPLVLVESGYLQQIYTDTNNCYAESDSLFIEVFPLPVFNFEDSYSVNKPNILEIEGPPGMSTYTWSPDSLGTNQILSIQSLDWPVGEYTIYLTVEDVNSCFYSDSALVEIDVNLGIEDDAFASTLSIYPNPCTTFLNVVSEDVLDFVEIYSLQGRLIYRSRPHSRLHTISVAPFPKGSYHIKLYKEDKVYTNTIIKL